jgi:hypothetical protein
VRREAWLERRTTSFDSTSDIKCWTKVWKVDVPSKIKVFLWRLAKRSLPTTDLLHHRNMLTTHACSLCGARDTWRHSLMECVMARSVWALAEEVVKHMFATYQELDFRHDGVFPTR